jgi:hypothetical protein
MRKLPVIVIRITVVMVIGIMSAVTMFLIAMVSNVSMGNLPGGESFNIADIVDAVVHRELLMGIAVVVDVSVMTVFMSVSRIVC